MITVTSKLFFFLTHKYTNSAFRSWILFSLPQPFSGFLFQSNPHTEDLFLILRNTRFHNRFYELLLLSRAPQDSIDTTVLSCLFLLCNIRTTKISYSKKYIFQSAP